MEDFLCWLDDGNCIDVMYFDFKAAFDSVTHERLLSKLDSYGISGKILERIKDFLLERSQKVRVGNEFSSKAKVLT